MPESTFHGRKGRQIENDRIRVTVLRGGGHLAELYDKTTSTNPLWVPKWPSIDPSSHDLARHPEYGDGIDGKLLCGIMGHNLCMDFFGAPSAEEFAAGLSVHGEASLVDYDLSDDGAELVQEAEFPEARLRFRRTIRLASGSPVAVIRETVRNLSAIDKPIAWQQHPTVGEPFLERGVTEFRVSATKSQVTGTDEWGGRCQLKIGASFDWPDAPLAAGGTRSMEVYTDAPVSGAITAHLMDPAREQAFFMAYSKTRHALIGYVWLRSDFPWMAIWEENHSRDRAPWNGRELTRGMEFGASPFPETRRQMIERGTMFGTPCYRWLPARSELTATYCAFAMPADRLPRSVGWDGAHQVRLEG